MFKYEKQRGAYSILIVVVILGFLLILAMFKSDAFRNVLKSQDYKDLAPWVQAVASVVAIIAAVFIAKIPIEQKIKDEEDLKKKNILLFWIKCEPMLKGDLSRVKDALKHFHDLRGSTDDAARYEKIFKQLVSRIMMMQAHDILDYSAAFDYSKDFLINLNDAQKNLVSIKRQITKSTLVDDDANSSSFANHALDIMNELKSGWFKKKTDTNEIILKFHGNALLGSLREQEKFISEMCRLLDLKIGISRDLLK